MEAHGQRRQDVDRRGDTFTPLRPTTRSRLVLSYIVGPVMWIVALAIAAWLVEKTDAIEIGAIITAASFLISLVALSLMRIGRDREERRYEARSQPR